MDEPQAKESLCQIIYRQQNDETTSLFGCGCIVKSSDGILKIATSRKIFSLGNVEIFAKFTSTKIKLQFPTEEESPGQFEEIAYLSVDPPLPDGFSKAEIEEVDTTACLVPVFEDLANLGGHGDFSFYKVERGEGKCSLKNQLGDNKRSIDSKRELGKHHLAVLGSPILSRDNFEFMGIMEFLEVENNESLLRIVYHDGIQRNLVTGAVTQKTESGPKKFSTADPMAKLWTNSIDFRDEFSKVLDYRYSEIKYWPHLAENFGIDKSIYDAFSKSDINSPTERLFEHLGATQPDLNIKELCKSLDETDAQEVYDIVKKSVEDKVLREEDLVTEMYDKAPKVLDTITLKLDREDRLWKDLARALKISKGTFQSFKTDRADNPARCLFDVLATEDPLLTIKNFKDKLIKLNKNDIVKILNDSGIPGQGRLRDLSKYPDVKSEIERILNVLKTNDLCTLASLYQQQDHVMEHIDIEKKFGQEENCHSPTHKMMEHVLASSKKQYTIEELKTMLKRIRRKDCLRIIEKYLKEGKDDIDKKTREEKNLSVAQCEGRKKPSLDDENVERAPIPAEKTNEEENKYLVVKSYTQ